MSVVERFGWKPRFSSGRIPTELAVVTEAASDDVQQYLAGVFHQRNTPVVAALCPVLLLMKHFDGGIFPLLRDLPPPSKHQRRRRAVFVAERDHR